METKVFFSKLNENNTFFIHEVLWKIDIYNLNFIYPFIHELFVSPKKIFSRWTSSQFSENIQFFIVEINNFNH